MLYLNNTNLNQLNKPWKDTINVIKDIVDLLKTGKYDQPIKPYLNFDNAKNRIIAMPARIGSDELGMSGIKWIASFPENTSQGKLRANSITILNDSMTGEPLAFINSSHISVIRTVSVTGYILRYLFNTTHKTNQKILIIGYGPIGQNHLIMLLDQFSEYINSVEIFDIQDIDLYNYSENGIDISQTNDLETSFKNADIVITATTSSSGYLNFKPKNGSVHLNISLRDYDVSMLQFFDSIIVDKWTEVCRAGTDIERMFKFNGLKPSDCVEITELTPSCFINNTVFFNPMGMAVFDIAIGQYILGLARNNKVGLELE